MLDIVFSNHMVPTLKISAFSNHHVYYIDKNILFRYNITNRLLTELGKLYINDPISNIFVFKDNLFLVSGNLVIIYIIKESFNEIQRLNLTDIPINHRIFNKGVIFFLGTSMQLIVPSDPNLYICPEKDRKETIKSSENGLFAEYRILDIKIPRELFIVDGTSHGNENYFLSRDGKVFQSKDIFELKSFNFTVCLALLGREESHNLYTSGSICHQIEKIMLNGKNENEIPDRNSEYSRISLFKDYHRATDSIILVGDKYTEKYLKSENKYLKCFQIKETGIVFQNLLVGKSGTILIKDAPVLLMNELIDVFYKGDYTNLENSPTYKPIGINASKIFFGRRGYNSNSPQTKYKILKVPEVKINENLVKIPENIIGIINAHPSSKELISKYRHFVLEYMESKELIEELRYTRQKVNLDELSKLMDTVSIAWNNLEKKIKAIKQRIQILETKQSISISPDDKREFKDNCRKVSELMKDTNLDILKSIKKRLYLQKCVLSSKL